MAEGGLADLLSGLQVDLLSRPEERAALLLALLRR
jgi:hypothetical protein